MKQFYLTVFLVFCLQFCFSQIGFEHQDIINSANESTSNAYKVFASDIDNDGDLDILSASEGDNKVAWYENLDGQGTFGSQHTISDNANTIRAVYTSDIDGDGDMDVLSASLSDNKIAWYENLDGQGTFGVEQIISTTAYGARSVYAGDLDGDGDIDVVSASYDNNSVKWYENTDGLGTFIPRVNKYARGANSVIVYDMDNDGDMDILFATESYAYFDKIAWLENTNGLGNFSVEHLVLETNDIYNMNIADIDNDGDIDILSASPYNDKIVWYENTDGSGSFGTESIISTQFKNPRSVFGADIDGDGDMDVLSASYDDSYPNDWQNEHRLAWYENTDGLGNFASPNVISTQVKGPHSVFGADIDNDGNVDVVSASKSQNYVAWQKNLDGLGDFSATLTVTKSIDGPTSIFTSDIDGDGDKDVVSSSLDGNIAWYKNIDGLGEFSSQQLISNEADGARSVYAADIDGDGDMDVISASYSSTTNTKIAWYENIDGLGNFGIQQLIIPTTYIGSPRSVFANDINNDGNQDIIAASGNSIFWYNNSDGLGAFGTGSRDMISSSSTSEPIKNHIYGSDIDGDGDIDVLSASENGKVIWYENTDGLGGFGAEKVIATMTNDASSVHGADVDGDGDIDVLSSSTIGDKIAWYENLDGFGNFGAQQIITINADGASSVYTSDIDGDGDLDVLSASPFDDKIAWYENIDGMGSFGVQQIVKIINHGFSSWNAKLVISDDIDNDGDMDVLSISDNGNTISWHNNLGLSTNEIKGVVSLNSDNNGCDIASLKLSNVLVTTNNGSDSYSTFTLTNGFYQLFPNEASFSTIASVTPIYYVSNPISHNSNFTGVGNTDVADFCIEPIGEINDLNITIYPSQNDPRPGFNTTYQIVYNNIGTTELSGSVSFEFDDSKLNLLNASETVASQTANTLTFDFTDLNPFETRTIDLEFNVFTPPTTNIGDELVATATVNPISGDETEADNVFTLEQTVISSYDPNDITVLEGDQISINDADKYLHYLIRFQNTGTASAINVNVEHILDDKLDWTTMQLESLSHTGRVEITNETDVSFIFNNIDLAHSTYDEPNSHGYIAYKIMPKSNVEVGDVISGTADIFFDFNTPITTNTVNTEIVEPLRVGDYAMQTIQLFPNPTNSKLVITSNQIIDRLAVIDINGRTLNEVQLSNQDYSLDVSSLIKGVYFLELQSGDSKMTKKFIKN